MRPFSTLLALVPFTVGAAAGCISADVSDRDFTDAALGDATPGVGPDGDIADGATDPPPPPPPPGCDANADPKDAPACVFDSYGVFVDATLRTSDQNVPSQPRAVKVAQRAFAPLARDDGR